MIRYTTPLFKITIYLLAFGGTFLFSLAKAQVLPDSTLGAESTTIRSIDDLRDAIEGGAIRGDNLFHSFTEFGIPEGTRVDFINPEGISNIFSRVTGPNISEIFGTLGVEGGANLFLMNPNGVIFGENAAIDIGGSFMATTAESIEFSSGDRFSAVSPESPLVTIDFPVGLGLGSNPDSINIAGEPSNIILQYPELEFKSDELPDSIRVEPGENISLIGGNINFDGGGLQAPGGDIELVSADGNQDLTLSSNEGWFTVEFNSARAFKDISLDNAAFIDTSGEQAGNITLFGRNIILDQGSGVIANSLELTDNSISINASNTFKIQGDGGQFNADKSFREIEEIADREFPDINFDQIENFYSPSFVAAYTLSDANKPQNNFRISINAKNTEIFNGGQIRTVGFPTNNRTASDIRVDSENILLDGTNGIDSLTSSSISGGNIEINSQSLSVLNGAAIISDTMNGENSGDLTIESMEILLQGYPKPFQPLFTGLFTNRLRTTNQGSININADTISILDGAKINTNSAVINSAGNIDITANSITVAGFVPLRNFPASSIASSVDVINANQVVEEISRNNGDITSAGTINISTDELKILDGARIESINNLGDSGNININASEIELNGTRPQVRSFIGGISTSTRPSSIGKGGNISIDTDSLKVLNGPIIRAISLGTGDAGNINITAKSIEIGGIDRFAEEIDPRRISKINTGASQANGGNLTIDAEEISLDNLGILQATTETGTQGGNIFLTTNNLQLNNQAQITASAGGAGNGGNITIDSDTILGLNNSDISANAIGGDGGNIALDSRFVVGLENRMQLTPQSDITATSEFGANGTVTINAPDSTADEDLIISARKVDITNVKDFLEQGCSSGDRRRRSELVYLGGGFRQNPDDFFDDTAITPEPTVVRTLVPQSRSNDVPPLWSPGDPIVEPNVVQINPDGRKFLVAVEEVQISQSQVCTTDAEDLK